MKMPKPGEIWLTRPLVWMPALRARVALGEELFVLVVQGAEGSRYGDEPDVRVVPLSSRVDMASAADVVLAPGETGFSFPVIAETWNTQPALVRNLQSPVARVDEDVLRRVVLVHDSRYSGVVPDVAAGTAITSADDPRVAFQECEVDRWEFLHVPVGNMLAYREVGSALVAGPEQAAMYEGVVGSLVRFPAHFQLADHSSGLTFEDALSPFLGGGRWAPTFRARAVAESAILANTYRVTTKGLAGEAEVVLAADVWGDAPQAYGGLVHGEHITPDPALILGAA